MTQADTPVRVLHLTARTDTGGLFRYVSQLCDGLYHCGHSMAVSGQLYQARDLFVPKPPWPWIDVPVQDGLWQLFKATRTLQAWMCDHPVDLLHVHFRNPMYIARRLARHRGPRIPILFTLHLSGIPRMVAVAFGLWRSCSCRQCRCP